MSQEAIASVLEQVDEIVISSINEHALVGLGVGIVHDGKLVYAKGFGMADAAQEKPVTPDTVFRVGSISKTFTAIGLMQLWEQGKFQLDDPINDYLKHFRVQHRDPNAPPVTFRHILTHTSGIGEVRTLSDMVRPGFTMSVKVGEPIPALKDYYAAGLAPEIYPGEKWAYANHAFGVLAQLVEDISGEPFTEYTISHVFEPLGMMHTDYLRSERVRDQLAIGYQLKKSGLEPVKDAEIILNGAGSVFSSVNDMGLYVAALLNGGQNEHGAVLKPETLQLMTEYHYQVDERLPGMGLAFFLDNFGGHHITGHGGGVDGFISAMYAAPDDDLGVLVFTNMASMAPDTIATDLMRRLLDVPNPVAQLPRPDIRKAPHLWSELCGFYGPAKGFKTNLRIWMLLMGEMEVLVKDNQLMMRTLVGPFSKGTPLYRVDADDPLLFLTQFENIPIWIAFERNAAGQVDRVYVAGPMQATLHKRPKKESLRFKVLAGLGVLVGLGLLCLGRRKCGK